MKSKGFTLIELLAVIVILAIISLIAVPIFINIIEASKKESTRLSVEHYLDSLEMTLAKENLHLNKNLDGTYILENKGKKITNEELDISLNIEYKGDAITNDCSIIVKNGKAINLGDCMAGKWYTKMMLGSVMLLDKMPGSTIVNGQEFNRKIKTLANNKSMWYNNMDQKIASIEFYGNGVLPKGYDYEKLSKLPKVDISSNRDGTILAFFNNEDKIYIYGEDAIIFNEDSSYMFSYFKKINNFRLKGIDTSNVTNMNHMFYVIESMVEVDVSKFNTSKVTDMSYMFAGSENWGTWRNEVNLIKSIKGLNKFNTSNVTTMKAMFHNAQELESVDVSSFDTSKVTDMSYMFSGYIKQNGNNLYGDVFNDDKLGLNILSEINGLENFNTSKVTDMSYMFAANRDLNTLNLSNFNTTKVISMEGMFSNFRSLSSVDISKFNTNNVTNMSWMFAGNAYNFFHYNKNSGGDFYGNSLTEIVGLDKLNTSNVTTMKGMFYLATNLSSVDVSNFNTGKVTDMSYMFSGYYTGHCERKNKLNIIGLDKLNTSNVTTMKGMFAVNSSLGDLDLSNFDTSKVTDMSYMFHALKGTDTINLSSFITNKVTDMTYMFSGYWHANRGDYNSISNIIGLSNFNTSNVTSMKGMFYGIPNITSLNLTNFNTSKVTDMSYMFSGVRVAGNSSAYPNNFTEIIGLNQLNTSKVTNMSNMFACNSSLENVDLSNFNTSNVTNMSYMFADELGVTTIDISNFDTSKVTTMKGLFRGFKDDAWWKNKPSTLKNIIGLNSLNTSKVTDMSYMFYGMNNIDSLNLTNFDTSSVIDMSYMFSGLSDKTGWGRPISEGPVPSSFTNLNLSSFDTSKVRYTYNMFSDSSNLKKVNFKNAEFTTVSSSNDMFTNVPNDIEIKVKNNAAKTWIEERLGNGIGTVVVAS